jgi:hypothetical protein
MKDRTLKNQKKQINKTLKQFQLAKTMIQLSITGTVSVITASLSFYFCPGFSSQIIKDARSGISFVQTASSQKFHELEDFLDHIHTCENCPEDTSGTQGIPDTSSVTANTSPVILGKAENLHMEAQTGSDGNSYDAAILDTSMGPMYYYNQGDTRWSSYLYGGSDPMQQYGCGPTAAAMLISSFTNGGEAITPVTIADWSSANGYYAPQSGSYHSLIPSVLTAYGFQVESVTDHSPQNAASLLSSGHILVALMGKGSLTQNGHFVLITKLLPDGNVSIADPNSFDNSTCEWELPLLMEELKKVYDSGAPLWAVSMAASNSSLS